MRFSLAVPLEHGNTQGQVRSYVQIEQIALALEIYGWSAIWLHNHTSQNSSQQQSVLRSLQLLSNVTDRIDLGAIVHVPSPEQQDRFVEDLQRIDDMSSGRVRVAIIAGEQLPESLQFAHHISRALELVESTWQARRIQIVTEAPIPSRSSRYTPFGMLLSQSEKIDSSRVILAQANNSQAGWLSRSIALSADALHSSELVKQLSATLKLEAFDECICEIRPFPSHHDPLLSWIQELPQSVLPQLAPHPTAISPFLASMKFENIIAH